MLPFKTITKASKKKRSRELSQLLADSVTGSWETGGNENVGVGNVGISARHTPDLRVFAGSSSTLTNNVRGSIGNTYDNRWDRHVRMSDVPKFVTAAETKAAIAARRASKGEGTKQGYFRIQSSDPIFRSPPATPTATTVTTNR